MDVFFELPPHVELTRDEYRLINAGLESGLEACDAANTAIAAPLRRTIEQALLLLARRIWPELGELDEGEEQ